LALCLALPASGQDGPVIRYEPLSIGAFSEFGVIQGGRFGSKPSAFRDEWVDHFGAYLAQRASIDDRWFVHVGIGGVFQYQKPEVVNAEWGGTQYRSFFIGPSIAEVEYEVLDAHGEAASWRVGMGMFPVKYNPDAANLGEYLFRTGPYPTYILNGGYVYVNGANASLQGAKSRFTLGNLSADVFLTTETTMPPLYDLSLAGIIKYRAVDGLLDLGAGINFRRLIPIHPSRTSVETPDNGYFRGPDGKHYSGNHAYYRNRSDFYSARLAGSVGNPQDSAHYADRYEAAKAAFDSVRAWTDTGSAGYINPAYSYYTQSGVILNAMAAVDLKKLLPASALLGPNDLRVYAEAALLGVRNYPVFYRNRMDRVPVMLGINLPGFRVLDLVAVQYEYFPSPHVNSFDAAVRSNGAIPQFVEGNDNLLSRREYADGLSRDNHSWSVLLRREVTRGFTVSAQAARDHIRSVSESTWAGPALDPNAILYGNGRNHWYWMIQFGIGI
jgi:hypothetical protein